MNENTELDLEWAKRGGVVHSIGYELMKYGGKIFSDGSMLMLQIVMCHSPVSVSKRSLRMATRAECESAGVEYIERPVSAEELRDDQEMLDFLIKNPSARIESEDGYAVQLVVGNYGAYTTWGEGATPREAIDAAMTIEAEKGGDK